MKPRTFASNAALFRWMEDVYLSALLLRKPTPMPAKWRGGDVAFTWVMPDADGGAKSDAFDFVATGVKTFTLDGAVDLSTEIGVEPTTSARGLDLVMTIPGRLALRCAKLAVTHRKTTIRLPPRPHEGQFLVWGDVQHSSASLVARVGTFSLVDDQGKPLSKAVAESPPVGPYHEDVHVVPAGKTAPILVTLRWMVGATRSSLYVQLLRQKADDATWRKFAWLPTQLDGVQVLSRDARTDGPGWAKFADRA